MAYEDTVLLKLRRDYAKDEVVMFALNKIQELQIENGKKETYIQELESEKRSFGFWDKKGDKLSLVIENKNLLNQLETIKKSYANGGQVWFEKYNNLKIKFDALNTRQFERQLVSLGNRLKKQYVHGAKLECKKSFLRNFIKDNIPEIELFYEAERDFDEKNNKAEIKVIPIKI